MIQTDGMSEVKDMLINGKWMNEPEIKTLISQLIADNNRLKKQIEHTVKHGKWKYYKNNGIYDTYKCSICKESFELSMDADISQEIQYCPNCGARMDGDTNG